MSDSTVGIVEPGSPTKKIDNEERTNDFGETVQRQRTASPMLETLTGFLGTAAKRFALALDPATSRLRVAVEAAAVTITGVTTVATVTNVAQIGGVVANLDQYNGNKAAVAGLRSRITVS